MFEIRCDPDHISHNLLKSSLPVISKPLANLFNILLSKYIFPPCWKIANIVLTYKGKEPHVAKNYRPISVLSCVLVRYLKGVLTEAGVMHEGMFLLYLEHLVLPLIWITSCPFTLVVKSSWLMHDVF